MTSQLNNTNENQDQVLQEPDALRPVFFEKTSARNSTSGPSDKSKRSRLDVSVMAHKEPVADSQVPSQPQVSHGAHDNSSSSTPTSASVLGLDTHHSQSHHHRHMLFQHHIFGKSNLMRNDDLSSDSISTLDMAPASSVDPSPSSHFTSVQKDKKPFDSSFGRKNSISRSPHVTKKLSRAPATSSSSLNKAPKSFRRFRSRSLPIINYTSRNQMLQSQIFPSRSKTGQTVVSNATPTGTKPPSSRHKHSQHDQASVSVSIPSLPPINLQSLKEIDLQEILKNPQLRHDILFDPQLQFRPNLDGDRGRKKKSIIEKYWKEIESECNQFFEPSVISGAKQAQIIRLPALFTTLRDILLSLLPVKDRAPVNEIMDIELVVQQFSHGSFDFVAMANWLGEVFKSHCAPMRDQWVSEMIIKFQEASFENSVGKLVQGLRCVFSILEAMKLDVANHQIRILRPVLMETAVDFERDYFSQLINHCKIDITDSLKWFSKNYLKRMDLDILKGATNMSDNEAVITASIIELLSCRNMATEFPSTLAFDHTRLVLLRADVRQLVCVQLCVVLYKQLVVNYEHSAGYRQLSLSVENVTRVQEEILAIVTDEHGNVKWTRNIQAIAIQLVKNVITDPTSGSQTVPKLPQSLIDFSYKWLMKQIQPSSEVYGLMEIRIFKDILKEISRSNTPDFSLNKLNSEAKLGSNKVSLKNKKSESELSGIACRVHTLVKFHWSVFGDFYSEYLPNYKQ